MNVLMILQKKVFKSSEKYQNMKREEYLIKETKAVTNTRSILKKPNNTCIKIREVLMKAEKEHVWVFSHCK